VWAYLERDVRLYAPDVADRPRWGTQEYEREADELNRLDRELSERGTPRDKHILDLYDAIRLEPNPMPNPVILRDLPLEEFHQFRQRIAPLNEEELAEELRKAQAEFERKRDEYFRDQGGDSSPRGPSVIV
jgi:hypothetical protein